MQNITHVRFFSCWDCEFLNQENSAKAKVHLSGKLACGENNPLYSMSESVLKMYLTI